MRLALVVALVSALVLAGCNSGEGGGDPSDEGPVLVATETTGVIRAVVIDEAVRPLSGVQVRVETPTGQVNQTTDADGFAGFEGLEPGTYFVEANKPGYVSARQSVAVVADDDQPPFAKFLLARLAGESPFYSEKQYDGFLQCAAGGAGGSANVCFIANFYPCLVAQTAGQACPNNTTSDRSYFVVSFIQDNARAPDWIQAEMMWDNTQTVSKELMMRLDVVDLASGDIVLANSSRGESPIFATFNRTVGDEEGIGTNATIALEAFTSSNVGMNPVGLAYNQKISYYVHAFYGYTPPPGWRFSDGGGVPQPPY